MTRPGAAPAATYLLALAGIGALLPTSGEGRTLLLVAGGALILWAFLERRTSARIPRNIARAADLLSATLVITLAASNFALRETSLASIGYVLSASQLARAFRRKTSRDLLVMHGTAVAQVALAAFLTRGPGYLPVLVATVFLGILASFALPMESGMPTDVRVFVGRPLGRAGVRSRIGQVLQPALLGVVLLLIGGVIFVSLPRGAPFRKALEEKSAAAPAPLDSQLPGPSPRPGRNPVTGFTAGVTLGQIGEIKLVPREAFTVRLTEAGLPVRTDDRLLYFRGAVMDRFDGVAWSRHEAGPGRRWLTTESGRGAVAVHPDLNERRPATLLVRQEYVLRASRFRALPLLGSPVGIELGESLPRVLDLGYDSFAAEGPHTEGFAYAALSLVGRDPMRPVLGEPLPEPAPFLEMHPDSTRLSLFARELAGEGDALEKIDRLLAWLRSQCSYTLRFKDRPPERPLEHFVFETRAGHCEYFASALAMMLRACGVPTRLVTGFRGGLWIEDLEAYYVRMSDAHSWVEAWIDGRGWIRLDPTPPDSNAVAVPESRVPGEEGLGAAEEDWLGERLVFLVEEFGPAERRRFFGGVRSLAATAWREGMGIGRPDRPWPPPVPTIGFGLLLLWLGLRLRASFRPRAKRGPARPGRRSPPPPPAPFYEEALRVLGRAGFRRPATESPRELNERVRRRYGEHALALEDVTRAFERSRYGLVLVETAENDRLLAVVRKLDEDLRRSDTISQ